MSVILSTITKNALTLKAAIASYSEYGKIDRTVVRPSVTHMDACLYRGNNGYSGEMQPCCVEHGCKPCLFVSFYYFTGAVIEDRSVYIGGGTTEWRALVWDGTTTRWITYASDGGWTYTNGCERDCTPENMALALAEWREAELPIAIRRWHEQAAVIEPGKWVRIDKGGRKHKDKVGRRGMIISRDFSVFGYNTKVWNLQLSLDSEDGERADVQRIWINEEYCTVVDTGECPTNLVENQVANAYPSWYYAPKEMKRAA